MGLNTYYMTIPSGSFSPIQIPGCLLWLDGADASTITLNSGNVSQWNDKSGNVNNAVQSVAAFQPAYSTGAVNGRNSLTFPGGGPSLNLTSLIPVANTSGFIVVQTTVPGSANCWLGDNVVLFWGIQFASSYLFYPYDNSGSSPAQSTQNAYSYSYSSTTSINALYTNNIQNTNVSVGNLGLSFNSIGTYQGGTLNGVISEIIIYNSVLSSPNQAAIQSYFVSKWAVP